MFGEGLEGLLRGGALGLREDGGHGVDVGKAMDLVAGKLEHGHGAKVCMDSR